MSGNGSSVIYQECSLIVEAGDYNGLMQCALEKMEARHVEAGVAVNDYLLVLSVSKVEAVMG